MGVAQRREREREERRNQILDAAERIIGGTNGQEATMDHVAAEAELSKGTLYLYFRNKDALYMAIAQRSLQELVERQEAVLTQGGSGLEQLEHFAQVQREFGRERPMRLKNMLAWLLSGFHADRESAAFAEYQQLVKRLMGRIVEAIELGKRDGSIRPDLDSFECVMHIWGGTMGMWMLYLNQEEVARRLPWPLDFDRLIPNFFSERIVRSIRNGSGSEGDV